MSSELYILYLLLAGCREAANCWYCFHSEAESQHFHLAGVTHSIDSCEIWHGRAALRSAGLCEISPQSVVVSPQPLARPPKSWKFPLFGKDSPCRGKSFDRFLQMLGAFMRQLPCRSVLNFTWFASQVTHVSHLPEFFCAPCMIDTF